MPSSCSVGVVVIGRNEGERLARCFASLSSHIERTVYVDSGSSDDSVALAGRLNIPVVELDPARPFTAARARNAGVCELAARLGEVDFVQFIDGDCELSLGWIENAAAFLAAQTQVAVVFGRLRERHPEFSVYNRLCQIEWDTPVGETGSSGGIAMMRTAAFLAAGGFREDLIAGEEPDLCHRIRLQGWKVHKLGDEMAVHDAAMSSVRQWWARSRRSGYTTAQAYSLRGREEPAVRRQVVSNALWALPLFWPLWPILWLKIARARGPAYATHIVAGKVPHLQGQVDYWLDGLFRRHRGIIEHK